MADTGIFGLNSRLDTADLLQKLVALQRRTIDIVEAMKQLEIQKLPPFQERINDTQMTNALATDNSNVSQLFSSKGTTTNTRVTFVGFTKNTVPGNYDIRVSGGVPQISLAGQDNYIDVVGEGNFFAGEERL